MNTAHIAQQSTDPTLGIGVKEDFLSAEDPRYWESVLEKEGLSMGRGKFGSRLTYGHRNTDTARTHDYKPGAHNATQKNRGKRHAEAILKEMQSGISAYAAIKQLGFIETHAYRALRRYRKNFHTDPTMGISEDSNVD